MQFKSIEDNSNHSKLQQCSKNNLNNILLQCQQEKSEKELCNLKIEGASCNLLLRTSYDYNNSNNDNSSSSMGR